MTSLNCFVHVGEEVGCLMYSIANRLNCCSNTPCLGPGILSIRVSVEMRQQEYELDGRRKTMFPPSPSYPYSRKGCPSEIVPGNEADLVPFTEQSSQISG